MHQPEKPSPSEIRHQLDILRRSDTFTGSDRLLSFLSYLVEETLEGRGENLREAVIGNAVYRRDPPYDPRIDSTVRVEARRLRKKLNDYFALDGRDDPVLLTIPIGSYIPEFTVNTPGARDETAEATEPTSGLFEKGQGASVAILPFKALSQDTVVKDFADGLTDELIYAFGTEPGVRVQSRSVVFPFAERQQPASSVAAELGVDVVLQGTVREQNDSIRVTVELSDGKGFVASSDRFDGPTSNRLQLQERIATTLISRLRVDISAMRAHKIGPRPAAVEAHSKVYRARRLVDRQMPAALYDALAIFQDLAATLPDYARGHAGIADCYCDLFRIGTIDRETAFEHARRAADRALEMDPRSADALTAAATVSAWLERDRDAAEEGFKAALAAGGNSRSARIYGVYLTIIGLHEEAERLFAEARRIEPFCQQQDIAEAISRYQSRRFDVFDDGNAALDARHAPAEAILHMALARFFDNDLEGARVLTASLRRNAIDHPLLAFAREEMDAWLGAPDVARRIFQAGDSRGSHFARATLAASVQDEERTIASLSRALDAQELSTVWMRSDPRFDWLRSTSEFARLLGKLEALRVS
ncbi:MAG: hypothetical protein KGI75_10605 [Rhizobiaceae bacterium]|nr:hypothetical protein [Rhizobiaceae bacterium]